MLSEENILILIPAFNEEGSIGEVIREIRACLSEPRILVVNDGSTDRTAERSREAGALVATHPFNLGVGTALQTGYKYAVRHGFQSVIQLDADGQHPPSYLPAFVKKLKETDADLVVGSRFLVDHGARIPFARKIGNRIFAKLLTVLTGESLTDPTSGYRAMKRSILQFCVRDTYGFDYPDADFLLTLHRSGFRVVEIPIEVKPRRGGASQHRGLRPVFYVLKMFLSIFIILLRKKSVYQR
jgi:glycosyltransferase involved in cell wall biosynthesis